jgi:hypothetical protein
MILIVMRRILKDGEELLSCWLAVEEARSACLEQWLASLNRIDEGSLDDQRIRNATARIDDLRRKSERQRALIRSMRERIKRKKELERRRKSRENKETSEK